ncbi:MAG: DegV family protein [Chloroflexi bacterium]|nr:DegV family protein [Chloroflexota bacterium]
MPVQIVTDSTADLPPAVIERLGITVIPLTIQFGSKLLRDGIDITKPDMFQRLARVATPPISAPPSQKQFEEAYADLTRQPDSEVVAIHLSSKLSQTFSISSRAATPLLGRHKIILIDSQSISVGLGMMVTAAAEAAHSGASLDEVVKLVRGMIPRIYIGFFVETLDYLARGGRIGKAQAILGAMLNIKPLLILEEGEIVALEKVRTRAKAIEKLAEFISEFARVERMVILHSASPDDVKLLIEQVELLTPGLNITTDQYGPVAATHVGPDALGVVVYEGA